MVLGFEQSRGQRFGRGLAFVAVTAMTLSSVACSSSTQNTSTSGGSASEGASVQTTDAADNKYLSPPTCLTGQSQNIKQADGFGSPQGTDEENVAKYIGPTQYEFCSDRSLAQITKGLLQWCPYTKEFGTQELLNNMDSDAIPAFNATARPSNELTGLQPLSAAALDDGLSYHRWRPELKVSEVDFYMDMTTQKLIQTIGDGTGWLCSGR